MQDKKKIAVESRIELLAKLFDDKKCAKNDMEISSLENLHDEVFVFLEKQLRPALASASKYKNRDQVYRRLQAIIDGVRIYFSYPQILGKSMVGIISFANTRQDTFGDLVGKSVSSLLNCNEEIPCFMIYGENNFLAVDNNIGIRTVLKGEQYEDLCTGMGRRIDIREMLHSFVLSGNMPYPQLTFCWLPRYMQINNNDFNSDVIEHLDALIMYGKPQNEKEERRWENYSRLGSAFGIPIYLIDEARIYVQREDHSYQDLQLTQKDLFGRLSVHRQNHIFSDHIRSLILDMQQYFQTEIQEIETNIKQLHTDLVNIEQEKTFNYLHHMLKDIIEDKEDLENKWNAIKNAAESLQKKCQSLEVSLGKYAGISPMDICQSSMIAVWKKIFIQAIEMEEQTIAKEYGKKLIQYDKKDAYLYEALLQELQNERISISCVKRIFDHANTEFVRHVKLRLAQSLGLSQNECMCLAKSLISLHTPAEHYYRALWEEAEQHWDKALELYRIALLEGEEDATEGFVRCLRNCRDVDELDSMLVPAYNYAVAQEAMEEKHFAKGMKLIKIAATMTRYLPAIHFLASDLYKKLDGNYYRNISELDKQKKIDNCIKIYQYILSQASSDKVALEKLGFLYKMQGDERRALTVWQDCGSKNSLYNCGRIYQYPIGNIPQNLDKAEQFFRQAVKLGHTKAVQELDKVQKWKKENKQQKEKNNYYNQHRNYNSKMQSTRTQKESSGCFITTATCQAVNKGDDCEELMAMRRFRDDVKQKDPQIADLIAEYYRIAPLIIEKISFGEDSKNEYALLWQEDISECYKMIQDREYKHATLRYISMVERLSRNYHVAFSKGVKEKIHLVRSRLNASNI